MPSNLLIDPPKDQTGPGPEAYLDQIDLGALERALRDRVDGEVRFDDGSRALYAADASNYRHVPIGVVIPRTVEAAVATVAVCREFDVPIVNRGGGTALTGATSNVAVVIDFSKYINRTNWIDPDARRASVEPGKVYDRLKDETEPHGLVFAPDTSTHQYCNIGGMLGNNSCGVHSIMGNGTGRTSDQVHELDILTYDGCRMTVGATDDEEYERIIRAGGRKAEIYRRLRRLRDRYADLIRERFPKIPRRVSGYNLDDLLPENGFHVARSLVGTEGTCVTVLGATLDLVPDPPERVLLVLGYPDVFSAGDHVPGIMGFGPVGLEGMDQVLRDDLKKKGMHPKEVKELPDGDGWLFVEFGGQSRDEAAAKARDAMEHLKGQDSPPGMTLFEDPEKQKKLWAVRKSGLGATARVPGMGDSWEGWEDSAVHPDVLGVYLRDLRGLLDRYDYRGALYGHFGQGCVHTRITFDFVDPEGVDKYRRFLDDAAELIVKHGGSFTGEHGDGESKAALLPKMFGPELIDAFREFKAIWDPLDRMNPGKVVNPYPPQKYLRLGPDYHPDDPTTVFKFPEDRGSLEYATERCVGVGLCRKDTGTMCPSYMVTREEKHSTRGRAHLLNEMLRGELIGETWKSEEVMDALDLCLACKACKSECPMSVDMATYKTEFVHHYYKRKLRPMSAYSMGFIYWWARLAALAPQAANVVSHAPGIGPILQKLGGITTERAMPAFAPRTFKQWWAGRRPRNVGKAPVILWADTFNNHFHPQTAIAAVEVLEDAGFEVLSPRESLCCGRPLYDFGFLGTAKTLLQEIMTVLHDPIEAGIPIVGLEPSCISVFRDELVNLFPRDHTAQTLSKQVFSLGEFLSNHAPEGYEPPKLRRKAIVHGHCHHKAIVGMKGEDDILKRAGVDLEPIDSGCCGLAGSFGFEPHKYDVSVAAGERVLAPRVREADPETLIVADGFSCREQIAHLTNRGALHLAQVLQMALRDGAEGSPGPLPERRFEPLGRWDPTPSWAPAAVTAGVGLLAGGALAYALTRRNDR